MLKALELHGFKSFADKTRFEFPPGITVVVGPNGSGKSNIVDCIKWVLGEQSAKSLRGKDMADVIFKGSGSSGRKPMNTAEATLVFENADKRLAIDAPEVHVTRRIYRSGEGEYLINRQPARLKDIRDLFRGTGLGGDAYSLIEQGKVDRLLNASSKDRRAIFEEAAGISRFKAKKIEAQRRLERVEQNMLRLNDIVEEVENRLKTVRAQAGKARRYREYSERLQQLRTQIALVDWRKLTSQLDGIEAELTQAQDDSRSADAEIQRQEALHLEFESAALAAGEELRNCENQIAALQQQLAGEKATIEFERSRSRDLAAEAEQHRHNLLAMSDKAGDVRSRLKATEEELAAATAAQQTAVAELTQRESHTAELATMHEKARHQADAARQEYLSGLQRAALLESQAQAGEGRLVEFEQSLTKHRDQLAHLASEERDHAVHLAAAQDREAAVLAQLAEHSATVDIAQRELSEFRNLHSSRAQDLAQLYGRQQGVAERASMLEDFERNLEGFGTGVKELLTKANLQSREGHRREAVVLSRDSLQSRDRWSRDAGESSSTEPNSEGEGSFRDGAPPAEQRTADRPWSAIKGILADLLDVKVEHAPAIDIGLGDAAQWLIVAGNEKSVQEIMDAAGNLEGRVTAVAIDPPPFDSNLKAQASGLKSSPPLDLTADMVSGLSVIARADKLVHCPAEYQSLVTNLLGRTFVVRTLDDAFTLRARLPAPARFVTLAGELIDEHGAIAFGPRQSATSLVSRRSQLRAARLDLAVLDQQIIDAQRETSHLKTQIEQHEHHLKALLETSHELQRQSARAAAELTKLSGRGDQLRRQAETIENEIDQVTQQSETTQAAVTAAREELSAVRTVSQQAQQAIAASDEHLTALQAQREQAASLATAAKVEVVRCQQRLEGLHLRMAQFEDDSRERERAIRQVRDQLRQAEDRGQASQLAILAAEAAIADLTLRQESLTGQMKTCVAHRDAATAQRTAAADALNILRRRAVKLRDQEHQLALAAEQVRHQRQTLADRLREDYRIELAELTHEPSDEEARERAAVEEEIETLRRKINQIGAVNLDALDELDDLEKRFATLSGQHHDLHEAKQSLERIIHKINADSRRLFLETLEAIRVNFQALYRQAFGGGKADILLEEGVDILECGVEIIATPPGKPSFNNSLLSGGEKALTAVALLLAIFQFRPSPFCILDEVDAPFDEANIGRFIDVLKDFLSWTRFVIVTHSKKTMTAATTLYGITMQESGVSKRVSVRFDDVTEDGHIRREALDRAQDEAAA